MIKVETKIYYTLLLFIVIFMFLWFFFSGSNYEELNNENEKKYICTPNDVPTNVNNTPNLPTEFLEPICHKEDNNKFLSKGEKMCRDTMEKIYGVPFKNMRPKWLKNPETGRCLELDCYNEKLKLAVEYNGEQHYVWPNGFKNQSYQDFLDQMKRDALKMKMCETYGVDLIVVPYNVPHHLIPTYIIYHLPEIVRRRLDEDHFIDMF